MKRGLVLIGILSSSVALAIVACGSDDAASDSESPDAGDNTSSSSSSSSSSSGASGSSTSSSSGASGGTDGGDGGLKEGGGGDGGSSGTSNPGKVTCGTTECATAGNTICCEKTAQDGGVTQTCEANCNGFGALDLRCDEKADCQNASDKCCLGFQGAQCSQNCGFGQNPGIQLCKSNAECGDAGPCNVKTCVGRQRSVCGSPFGCQ